MGQKIAADCVTAIDDGTIPNAWGSINIDDEGVPAQKNILIENGILTSYLVDKLNGRKMGMASTGSGRRESYRYAPTSRMTNTFIANGTTPVNDIIANTEYGLYAKKMGGGSVQPATGEFNFAVLEGYMIRGGKIAEPVRGATLIGKGGEVLLNIDMVGDNLDRAQGVCGSASGSVPTDVGQPMIRVKELTVGGRK
jgi:TldD protein